MTRWLSVVSVIGLGACIPDLFTTELVANVSDWEAPTNTWPASEPPASLTGEGFEVGEIVPDFRLTDQLGDEVSLWQFYGSVVLLDISTMWCAPCQDLAVHTEETAQDYADQDFVYLTVLQQNVESEVPDIDDLTTWADTFGITAPVLSDGDGVGTGAAVRQGQYPAVLVLDREVRVTERVNPIDDAQVRLAIEAAL